jgi:hypothetical protein
MSGMSLQELDAQQGDLLPAREALTRGGFVNAIGNVGYQKINVTPIAVQGLTLLSKNSATANVTVVNGVVLLGGLL